jgi:hypothetical protein
MKFNYLVVVDDGKSVIRAFYPQELPDGSLKYVFSIPNRISVEETAPKGSWYKIKKRDGE